MIIEMKKRNGSRGGIGKEKAIMLAASVFVLSALTLTGVYVRENNVSQNDDGFSIDLSSLENNNIVDEQAEADVEEPDASLLVQNPNAEYELDLEAVLEEGELDNAELAGLGKEKEDENAAKAPQTNQTTKKDQEVPETTSANETQNTKKENTDQTTEEDASQNEEAALSNEESASVSTTTTFQALEFKEEAGLIWPTVGEILINYSMDQTIYFPTLAQYKYNPAVIIQAAEGKTIVAAADAQILDIYEDDEIGHAVKMDLGNGYELIYGQLADIQVSKGAYVSAGDVIGTVGAPTKYYSVEGSNLYLKLSKDGEPRNPMSLLP
ncbi:MAG: peptidoglycan DD-metalloendopeptidase family protein [Lachnospiraceae bacterium]|nr:peptidoglycan DD-metalloendopeptidase family protein [Lachnospiraceae bacterium]